MTGSRNFVPESKTSAAPAVVTLREVAPAARPESFSAKAKRRLVSAGLFGASAALITFGFAVDGTSEVGHHAGFILGGVALGYGFGRR
jgi:hypothetical protein